MVVSGDSIRVRTVRPSGHGGNMGASYLIRVPRRTALERIESSNGRIQVTGIEGAARLETSNGSIEANALSGALTARTSNGSVRVGRVLGELNIDTSNGSIRASAGKLERPVTLHTSNGSIELSVEALGGSGVNVSTSNASITLRLPSSAAASLTASTSNGSITNQFESEFRGRSGKNHLDGTIGAGGPRIRLDTSNGSIRLLRL
ncbi:MAG: hypothetical protein EHM65_08680 [Acidobacteriales bacterium]|nr:MAG: hypothetical protein EHM65_08680 [Terriglobales bacterium]